MASYTLNDCTPGRTAAYTFYHLGGSVLVGLVRLAITIYHLAKHLFIEHKAKRALEKVQDKSLERRELALDKRVKKNAIRKEESSKSKQDYTEARGITRTPKAFVHAATKTAGALGDFAERLRQELQEIGERLKNGPKKG